MASAPTVRCMRSLAGVSRSRALILRPDHTQVDAHHKPDKGGTNDHDESCDECPAGLACAHSLVRPTLSRQVYDNELPCTGAMVSDMGAEA